MERRGMLVKQEMDCKDENFGILSPYAFLHEVTHRAESAQKRVWLQTMHFENDSIGEMMGKTLSSAAARDVDCRLNVDYFSHMIVDGKIAVFPSPNPRKKIFNDKQVDEKRHFLDDLRSDGITVTLTNEPQGLRKYMPQKGRNHVKLAVVDDVAYLGGLNMAEQEFHREDFMMRITDKGIVDALADTFEEVNGKTPTQDSMKQCTADTRLLVDVGNPGDSLILDEAVMMVDQATSSIAMVTQVTPDTTMRRVLVNAGTDKEVEVIVSAPDSFDERCPRILDRIHRVQWHRERDAVRRMDYPQWVHAKILLVDRDIPDKAQVIVGSHNFLESGAAAGTQEIALQSTNSVMISRIREYYEGLRRNAA